MGYFSESDLKEIDKMRSKRKSKDKTKKGLTPFKELGAARRVFRVVWCILLILVLIVALLLGVLTVAEYRPEDRETVEVTGGAESGVKAGQEISVLTWNVGYGALGDNADFFMDGGTSVKTADEARVNENMNNILAEVETLDPDVCFFQEVDIDSGRSYHINEADILTQDETRDSAFAYNFRCLFIPYPIPPIGTVNGGILTTSKYDITSSERIQLPCPFSWPVRLGNLKRCLDVSRVSVSGSSKELVLVNLHLEAYDDGEGKEAQTAMLLEILEEETAKGNYVIAAGDFNQSFSDVDLSDYPTYEGMWTPGIIDVDQFSDFQLAMDDSTPSCRSLDKAYVDADKDTFQYYVIDGFIVSNNVTIESVETQDLDFQNSDHNPVLLKAVLK